MIEAAIASTAVQRPKLRGMLHAVAFAVSCLVGALFLAYTPAAQGLAAAVFAVSASVMLGTSALYHCVTWSPRRRLWMRRADHAALFLLIAGTYTPVAWFGLHGTWRAGVLAVVWSGATVAIATKMCWVGSPKWLSAALGIALGWAAVIALPQLARSEGLTPLLLLATGGI